ncbi:MAG: archease, partial [Candidatus Thorarchaeota archaeon]|nr:archease [Candidatus Thorarchaeota archaeon]
LEIGSRIIDHTADITIECWAPTLEQAYSEAARAAFEVILDTSTVEPRVPVEVEVHGIDLKELLVEWIGRLIALIDINYHFYSKFEVQTILPDEDGLVLRGVVWGEDIDHNKHVTRTEVKAMTYANMAIDVGLNRTTLRFTLDL